MDLGYEQEAPVYQTDNQVIKNQQISYLCCMKGVIRSNIHWNRSTLLSETTNYCHHFIIATRQRKITNKINEVVLKLGLRNK